MNLLIEDVEGAAFDSLFSDKPTSIGEIVIGGSLPVTAARLKRIATPFNGRVFDPQTLSGWSVRAAIGGGFILPVAGSWVITFTAADASMQSSGWTIPYNPSSDDIQNTLNSLSKVTAIGGVTVQGSDGFFEITFNNVGVRNLLTGNPARLVPLSLLTFARAVTGDSTTQEVQTLRILQNTGAISSLTADSASTTITQSNLIAGDASHNANIRLTLPVNRYDGTWTVTRGGTISDAIGYADNEAQVQVILQKAFGAGNVLVSQSTPDSYDLTFAGTLGLQAITITLDGSALLILPTFSGRLDLTAVGVDLLLQANASAVVSLEIEGVPSGGYLRKLFQSDVLLKRPVVNAGSSVPVNQSAFTGSEDDLSISTAQTITLAPSAIFSQWFQLINVAAGSLGAYTVNVVLSQTNPVKGAIYRIELDFAASSNPTVNIRDNSVGGTILDTIPGDVSQATYYLFEGRFDGSVWKKLSGRFE